VFERVSPREWRDFLVVGDKQSGHKHRGRMTATPGALGKWVYLIHPLKSVGFGLRKGP